MGNFIKVIFFLIVVVGIGFYFLSRSPSIFQGAPREKISAPSPTYTTPPKPSAPAATLPQTQISNQSTQIPDSLIPSGFNRSQISPYFQKIKISSAYNSSLYGYPTQIQLSAYSLDKKVDITGWKIKSNSTEFFIPQAVNIYSPSGSWPSEDIVISGSAYINIYSSKSPVNVNFRLNKCTGYLNNNYSFNPTLPQNCPTIQRSETINLSGQCQSYIFSLGNCKETDLSFYNSLPGTDQGNACRTFLSTINWYSCFQKHQGDIDFLSGEWRIWLNWGGLNNILDSQHDTVRLFDSQGLLVDQNTY